MRITDLLSADSIELNGKAAGKEDVLKQIVDLMVKRGNIQDKEEYLKTVLAREEEGTTGIGEGIAIPHGKCSAVSAPGLAAMVVKDGVEYDALDGEPVYILFLIAAPNTKDNVHLDVLSKLSVLLMDEGFTDALRKAGSREEFLQIIEQAEDKKDAEEREKEEARRQAEKKEAAAAVQKADTTTVVVKKLVAVTACPTGIAHTYMAAEALEKKAKELGYQIKVETRGSGGAKNVITAKEIEEADGVIVAADTNVPMDRFDGKHVVVCQVSAGIGKPEELIRRALSGEAPVYHASGSHEEQGVSGEKESTGHRIYKHLMNGVSHMLPFVVGGGILIAIAFLIDGFSVDIAGLADKSLFGTITPAAAFFKGIGGLAFGFMLPVLAGFIAESIADRPGLAVGFVGGMIAANGKSGFLGALAAGFIAGYLVVALKKIFEKLPKSLEGIKPVLLYPLLGTLLIGVAMTFVIEPVVGFINTGLTNGLSAMNGTSSILLGLVLAGMMAVDMGGPFNKAAYVFGTAAITSGNYNVMAAVMIGGMVPPCAIALATLLFKKKFTAEERKSGPTNFIMGLSFITEGAIPFAASDPLHVIPACVIGSGLAGALSMIFGCTLMAPHGGIFVFPVVGNALLYLVALAAGTAAGAFLLGVLKKDVK